MGRRSKYADSARGEKRVMGKSETRVASSPPSLSTAWWAFLFPLDSCYRFLLTEFACVLSKEAKVTKGWGGMTPWKRQDSSLPAPSSLPFPVPPLFLSHLPPPGLSLSYLQVLYTEAWPTSPVLHYPTLSRIARHTFAPKLWTRFSEIHPPWKGEKCVQGFRAQHKL